MSCADNLFQKSFEGLEDLICFPSRDESFQVFVPVLDPFADIFLEDLDAAAK